MKGFEEWHGQLWRLCFDQQEQRMVWRCMGPVMPGKSAANGIADQKPPPTEPRGDSKS